MKKKRINYSRLNSSMRFPSPKKAMLINAFFYLCYSRLLLKTTSFKKLAARLGEPMTESTIDSDKEAIDTALQFGKSINKLSNYTPFRSMCFEQALALKFLLNKKGIASTIYLGVLKVEDESKLKAHAWTRVGNVYPTGNKGKESFTIISTFGLIKQD
ncbi:MAG: lasso peptide biosynthesis B2 protein [Flavobacteriales bacterium]|nr:lasso peptide biosynthesis B2 protein [Flavobacteriales bacterium]